MYLAHYYHTDMKEYNSPEVTEYGTVTDITEQGGPGKTGEEKNDEYSDGTPLRGTVV